MAREEAKYKTRHLLDIPKAQDMLDCIDLDMVEHHEACFAMDVTPTQANAVYTGGIIHTLAEIMYYFEVGYRDKMPDDFKNLDLSRYYKILDLEDKDILDVEQIYRARRGFRPDSKLSRLDIDKIRSMGDNISWLLYYKGGYNGWWGHKAKCSGADGMIRHPGGAEYSLNVGGRVMLKADVIIECMIIDIKTTSSSVERKHKSQLLAYCATARNMGLEIDRLGILLANHGWLHVADAPPEHVTDTLYKNLVKIAREDERRVRRNTKVRDGT